MVAAVHLSQRGMAEKQALEEIRQKNHSPGSRRLLQESNLFHRISPTGAETRNDKTIENS